MFQRILGGFAVILLSLGLTAQTAAARDWYRAESQHFIVYSEDTESNTLEFVQDLERLDEVLRLMTGIGPDDGSLPPSTKVTVFRFGQTSDMSALAVGRRNTGIGGFFIPRASGAVAFVPRQNNVRRTRSRRQDVDEEMLLDPKAVLFHEYVHYFMFQHRDAPYPLWYSEGFAELFSNLEFNDDHFVIGEVPTWRSASLATIPIDLQATFDPDEPDRYTTGRTYAHGWLIASHLNLNPERRGQMGTYMQAIGEGRPIMEAAEIAFGDLDVLRDELEEFRQGRARILRVPYAVEADPAVEIRQLDEAEEARMRLMMRSKVGVDEETAQSLVGDARGLVARYPDSVAVLLAATEAEFDARNYDEAESLAERVLAIDPESTEAAIYRAQVAFRRSFENPAMLEVARDRFVDANLMETDHAFPLYGYYLTYLFDDSVAEPPEDARAALQQAFRYAAFDGGVRRALVHMLLMEDRVPEARIVGANYLTGNGTGACVMRARFDLFEEGNTEPLMDALLPDHPGEYLDEEAREARFEEEREEFEAEAESYGCEIDD